MNTVPCADREEGEGVSTLGFIIVVLASVLAALPCKGWINAGLFILGLIFIYRG
jgi:hypothetical protein